ncbi:MAG: DUF2721 domain-containing protein [Pontixanthobacter sp.]
MIAQTIQTALTPVFVLVAIASILNVLAARLARIVDRSRNLLEQHGTTQGDEHDRIVSDIRILARRIELTNRAILMLVLSGVTIGVTVVLLFVAGFTGSDLDQAIGGAFIAAVGLMMTGLIMFLRETQHASAALRIPETYLELDRTI